MIKNFNKLLKLIMNKLSLRKIGKNKKIFSLTLQVYKYTL